jgi:hypothetical protein
VRRESAIAIVGQQWHDRLVRQGCEPIRSGIATWSADSEGHPRGPGSRLR